MKTFDSDGVELAYTDEGEGEPILLIHGFASNIQTNWVDTGWTKTLRQAGRRVIAIDNRGHGASEKLYDPEYYAAPLMAGDAGRLLDHLEISQADIMGYSMGARITAFLTMQRPEKVRGAILAGLGINMVRGLGGGGPIASALEAPSIDDVVNRSGCSRNPPPVTCWLSPPVFARRAIKLPRKPWPKFKRLCWLRSGPEMLSADRQPVSRT